MTEFRMPDSYYDPPEYNGCEDCECEDPEHPALREDENDEPCSCACHDNAHDPREDGDD